MKKILFLLFTLISLASFGQVPDTSRAKKVYGNMIWVRYDTTAATWDTLGIFPGATPEIWSSSGLNPTFIDTGYVKTTGDTIHGNYWFKVGSEIYIGVNIFDGVKINGTGVYVTNTSTCDSHTEFDTTKINAGSIHMHDCSLWTTNAQNTDVSTTGITSDDAYLFSMPATIFTGSAYIGGGLFGSADALLIADTSTSSVTVDGDLIVDGTLSCTHILVKTPPVYKTLTGTLSKTDRFVLASGDITLTAPAITSADSGLTITVKNIGNPEDLVLFVISGTTADGVDTARVMRWMTRTIVAGNDGKWYVYEKSNRTDYVYDISQSGSFQTIQECISFLDEHMAGPSVIRLGGGDYEIDSTITIDLPYPLTLRGFSYQTTNLIPVTGLNGLPMFRCLSDVSIENFQVDATDLASYGDSDGEDFIRFAGSGTYNEIKNFSLIGFWNGIVDSTDAQLWIQEGDISLCNSSGIKLTGAEDSVILRVVTTDFIGCDKGIWLLKGSKAFIDIDGGCGFRNGSATDSAIVYVPATFTNYINMYISGTTFNNTGVYLSGFDFTRSDGRDANIFIDNNAGVESKNPHAYINVLNNASTTTCTAADTMYKAVFANTSSYTCKFTIADNKMTYQPTNRRDVVMTISGNMSVNANTRNLNVCVLKNGIKTTKYGEMTVRATTSGQAYPFATTVYLQSVSADDYFEIFVSSPNAGDLITVQDVTWMARSF